MDNSTEQPLDIENFPALLSGLGTKTMWGELLRSLEVSSEHICKYSL